MASRFNIHAMWQSRREPASAVAARLRAFLIMSRPPPDRQWYCCLKPDGFCNLSAHPDRIAHHVENSQWPDETGEISPNNGYNNVLLAMCGDEVTRPDDPYIDWSIGRPGQNYFELFTDNRGTTDPRFVTYNVMKANVLAVARAFEPDWCQAGPSDLIWYLDLEPYVRPPMGLAWMIWFSPAVAALIEPPVYSNTIIERLTDGSLFMATSTETFDCANFIHLDQARTIHRQVDPLNYTLPFCGLSGRSDRVPPFPKL